MALEIIKGPNIELNFNFLISPPKNKSNLDPNILIEYGDSTQNRTTAEQFYLQAYDLLKSTNSDQFIKIILKLANFYYSENKFMGLTCYLYAAQKYNLVDDKFIYIIKKIAVCYQNINQFENSIIFYKYAIDYGKKNNIRENPDLFREFLILINNFGNLNILLEYYDQALIIFQELNKIQESYYYYKFKGENFGLIPYGNLHEIPLSHKIEDTIFKIANIYFFQKNHQEALKYYESALDIISEKLKNKQENNILIILEKEINYIIGYIHILNKDYYKTELITTKMDKIFSEIEILLLKVHIYINTGKYKEAVINLNKIYNMLEDNPEHNLLKLEIIYLLGKASRLLNNYDLALNYFKDLENIPAINNIYPVPIIPDSELIKSEIKFCQQKIKINRCYIFGKIIIFGLSLGVGGYALVNLLNFN